MYYYIIEMRVKKDKAYVVVTKEKERVHGAFPFTNEGKTKAYDYLDKISRKEKDKAFKVKVV